MKRPASGQGGRREAHDQPNGFAAFRVRLPRAGAFSSPRFRSIGRADQDRRDRTTPLDAGYLECVPKAGLKVLDHIRFNPDTADFTPLFHQIEDAHPDVIITGISHVGVQPTVQWHDQQVPMPMFGISAQATTSAFWKDTNGAAEGIITVTAATPDVALSPAHNSVCSSLHQEARRHAGLCRLLGL